MIEAATVNDATVYETMLFSFYPRYCLIANRLYSKHHLYPMAAFRGTRHNSTVVHATIVCVFGVRHTKPASVRMYCTCTRFQSRRTSSHLALQNWSSIVLLVQYFRIVAL